MSTLTFRLNTREFDRTLARYLEHTKRALPEVLNKKAFYITRRAVVETPKANKSKIVAQLRREKTVFTRLLGEKIRITKKGIKRTGWIKQNVTAPLFALILNARRGRQGKKGLYGRSMKEAENAFLAARVRSIAFLKAGWLPALRILAQAVGARGGATLSALEQKQVGQDKGTAKPASPAQGWKCKTIIENAASARHDRNAALIKYGQPPLQRAFDFEKNSMDQWIKDRCYEEGKKLGIKILGR